MISWLKGQIIKNWQIASKKGVILNVGGVGYEVQLIPKQIGLITDSLTDLRPAKWITASIDLPAIWESENNLSKNN